MKIFCNTLPIDQYIAEKLEMLRKEFHIKPKVHEVAHLQSLKNEIQVDNYIRDLFRKYL